MKKTLLSLSVIALAAFASCGKKDSTPSNAANVMFVNGCVSPTTTNLDGKINNVTVNGATNISYLRSSGYKSVTAVTGAAVTMNVTSLGTLLVGGTQTFAVNNHYSVFAGGMNVAPSYVFTTDDLTAPASGKAKVRFVNLCGDNLNVSCYLGATKIDSNIGYKTCTRYYEVANGSLNVTMVDQAVLVNSASITNQTLLGGKIYTFMLTGTTTASTTDAALKVTAINNN
jgi:hypothetical protein